MRRTSLLSLVGVALLVAPSLSASKVKLFQTNSMEGFLKGTLERVSLDSLGTLQLASRVERLAEIEEPFVLSASATADGWVLGTGNAGKVLLVKKNGSVDELFAVSEPEIFAVWADDDGTVFAGSSPDGKVYRYRDGQLSTFFEPQQKYIWAIARDSKNRLLVATGTDGKLFRVDGGGESEVLYDAKDPHIRSLLATADGRLYVGTAGEGLVLELEESGSARTLYDAPQPEITSLVVDGDGALYVAALASEASLVDLSAAAAKSPSKPASEGEKSPSVSVETGTVSAGSRPKSFSGARSEIVRIDSEGTAEKLWSFEKETVFALRFEERLWAATGLEGKIYARRGEQMVLEKDVDELQVIAILGAGDELAFVTTNTGALYRTTGGREHRGTYVSDSLDAGSIARFGTLHWRGDATGGSLAFQARSGMSSEPDDTWSDWSQQKSGNASAAGGELALGDVPQGRYVQWRAVLEGRSGDTPTLLSVDLSYVQSNRKPEISKLTVLEPGQIIVPTNFNPSNQAYEPEHPNRDGIFTVVGGPAKASDKSRRKRLWKHGFRTIEWEAEDPNKDQLEFALLFRREGGSDWLKIKDQLEEAHLSFDSTVLPDGLYRFKLVATDQRDNPPAEAKVAEKLSELVTIDHSPPTLQGVQRAGRRVELRVQDELSPLREAVYSLDAGSWKAATATDGLVDGRSEGLQIEVGSETRLLLVRITDAAFNTTTFDLSGQLESTERGGP